MYKRQEQTVQAFQNVLYRLGVTEYGYRLFAVFHLSLIHILQSLGYRCLYGLFLIPALFFGIIGNLVIAVVSAVRFAVAGMAKLWWSCLLYTSREAVLGTRDAYPAGGHRKFV